MPFCDWLLSPPECSRGSTVTQPACARTSLLFTIRRRLHPIRSPDSSLWVPARCRPAPWPAFTASLTASGGRLLAYFPWPSLGEAGGAGGWAAPHSPSPGFPWVPLVLVPQPCCPGPHPQAVGHPRKRGFPRGRKTEEGLCLQACVSWWPSRWAGRAELCLLSPCSPGTLVFVREKEKVVSLQEPPVLV